MKSFCDSKHYYLLGAWASERGSIYYEVDEHNTDGWVGSWGTAHTYIYPS